MKKILFPSLAALALVVSFTPKAEAHGWYRHGYYGHHHRAFCDYGYHHRDWQAVS